MLDLHYGGPVKGKQRFDRPGLQSGLIKLLEKSNGIKMFGLRRIGKSTLRLYAVEEMAKKGAVVVFVDAQGMRSLDQLLFAVLGAIPRKEGLTGQILSALTSNEGLPAALRTSLKALVPKNKKTSDAVAAYWQVISDAIVSALQKEDANMFLVVDEFSFLVRNMAEDSPNQAGADIDRLLASMRQWREAGLKMLLTGSIGMAGLSRKYRFNTEHLNDLERFSVPELSGGEATAFVRDATAAPPKGKWTDKHIEAFKKACGVFYPCFLVKGLLALDREDPPAPKSIEAIFREKIRPELHDSFINQFNRYFKLYKEADSNLTKRLIVPVLKAVMTQEKGCPQSEFKIAKSYDKMDLAEVLEMLCEDGFLDYTIDASDNRSWLPGSRLALIWWKRSGL